VHLLSLNPFSQSGIAVNDALLTTYEDVKLRQKHKYIVFTLEKVGSQGNKSTWDWKVLETPAAGEEGDNQAKWEEMCTKLPEDQARFVVFDFNDTKADGRLVKKLVLIKWYVNAAKC
jgi:septin family protein